MCFNMGHQVVGSLLIFYVFFELTTRFEFIDVNNQILKDTNFIVINQKNSIN